MKTTKLKKIITLGIIMLLNSYFINGQTRISKVKIKYVDFLLQTDGHVDCDDFEKAFNNFKVKEIYDTTLINKISHFIKLIKKDKLNQSLPDSRVKVYVFYKDSKKVDIICASLTGISFNNLPIVFDNKFIHLLKKITEQ